MSRAAIQGRASLYWAIVADGRRTPIVGVGLVVLAILLAAGPVGAEQLYPEPVNSAYAEFGSALAIDGDTLVAASWRDDANGADSGAVWVFQRDQGGLDAWGQVTKLTPAGGSPNDRFGSAVAISGDTVVVLGKAEIDEGTRAATAFVFERHYGGTDAWGEVTRIAAPADVAFGDSLALDGDTVVVSGRLVHPDGTSIVFSVFERDIGGVNLWGEVATVVVSEGRDSLESVAIDGDVIVAGKPPWACLYGRNEGGADAWGRITYLSRPPDGSWDFGRAVAIGGDTVIVGDEGAHTHSGVAFVFDRNQGGAGSWGLVTTISVRNARSFGRSVAISGDTVVVGDPDYFSIQPPYRRAAFLFSRHCGGSNSWGLVTTLLADDDTGGFGHQVAISDDGFVAIAAVADSENGHEAGAVYLFDRDHPTSDSWGQVVKQPAPDSPSARGRRFGESISVCGGTIAVGAPWDSSSCWACGSTDVLEREPRTGTWHHTARLAPGNATPDMRFGSTVAVSGDTIVAGAPYGYTLDRRTGLAYVYRRDQGGAGSWGQVAQLNPCNPGSDDHFGSMVAIDGDTIVIGSAHTSSSEGSSSAVHVFVRQGSNPEVWQQTALLTSSDPYSCRFGSSLAIDGDIVAAGGRTGCVLVFTRDAPGSWREVATLRSNYGVNYFGTAVSVSGGTIVVGDTYRSIVHVFKRNRTGAWCRVDRLASVDPGRDEFGSSVSVSGESILVGAWRTDDNIGTAYHYRWKQEEAAWALQAALGPSDGGGDDWFGYAVSIDDGTAVVGVPSANGVGEGSGMAYVYHWPTPLFSDDLECGGPSAWSLVVGWEGR